MKKNLKKIEKKTLKETFYAIQKAVPSNKVAYYDGRKIKWDSYTFEDFADNLLEDLKDKNYKVEFFKIKTNVEKIRERIQGAERAFLLTHVLPDSIVVKKEMLSIIVGKPCGGSMIKLGN